MSNIRRHNRGFVMLLILVVITMTTVIVGTQLMSVRDDRITSIKGQDEVLARAIAETCSEIVVSYLSRYTYGEDGVADNEDSDESNDDDPLDFDKILNPDGLVGVDNPTSTDGDGDYMPPIDLAGMSSIVIYVPQMLATNATRFMHQYMLFPVNQGACLVRF